MSSSPPSTSPQGILTLKVLSTFLFPLVSFHFSSQVPAFLLRHFSALFFRQLYHHLPLSAPAHNMSLIGNYTESITLEGNTQDVSQS